MGNQLTIGVDINPSDILSGLQTRSPLGGGKGRLLRTMRCANVTANPNGNVNEGDIVCKMFLKHDESDDTVLANHAKRMKRCEHALNERRVANPDLPSNVCFYSVYSNMPWPEMKAAYVIRTYFRYSLPERVMTRPFLTIEFKLWLSYQLLLAVEELHTARISHGDLKSNNVMVSSLGWLYVTDIAPFKPSHVKPAEFSYYFDSAENRHCSLAPERLIDGRDDNDQLLTEKSTELVNEKMDVFGAGCALSELFLGGEPLFKLDQLLAHKHGKYAPRERLSEKIDHEGVINMIMSLVVADPSKRLTARECIKQFTAEGVFPEFFKEFHQNVIGPLVHMAPDKRAIAINSRLDEVLEFVRHSVESEEEKRKNVKCASVLLATVVCGTVQHCLVPQNKIACLCVMMKIAPLVEDETTLNQLLPYAVTMLKDPSDLVRSSAVKAVARTVGCIESFPPGESNLFDDYVIPAIEALANDRSVVVRAVLAEYVPEMAHHARRLLETRQLLPPTPAEGRNPAAPDVYDNDLDQLQGRIQNLVHRIVLSGDLSPWVTRGFLVDITKLSVFLGRHRTTDSIFPMLTLFLNAQDYQVRMELQRQLVGIAVYVGSTFLGYILPCVKEGLMDSEGIVANEALQTLTQLTLLGMLERASLKELAEVVAPLLLHPSTRMRRGALDFFAAVEQQLENVDLLCFVVPLLKPFLRYTISQLASPVLAEALQPPIPRAVLDKAIALADPKVVSEYLQAQAALPGTSTGMTERESHLRVQLVRRYVASILKNRRGGDDSRGGQAAGRKEEEGVLMKQVLQEDPTLRINAKLCRPLPTGQGAEDALALRSARQLGFSIEDVDAVPASPGVCPKLSKIRPTSREKKRMELKAVAFDRKGCDAWTNSTTAGVPRVAGKEGGGSDFSLLKHARPTTSLICQAEEHSSTVTDIAVHDSLPIFLTSSTDTYVRLWDVRQLNKDSALVSPTGYCDTTSQHGKASPVLSVAVLTSSRDAAACGTAAGSFTIFCLQSGVVLHGLSLAGGNSGAIGNLRRMSRSDVVVAGTHSGYVCGVDCRMQSEAFCMQAAREHGPITSIAVGDECGRECWVVSATMSGYITLWDLRFRMPIKTWKLNEPVNKLALNGPDPVVLVATSEVQRWSLKTLKQVAAFRPSTAKAPQGTVPSSPDEGGRYGHAVKSVPACTNERPNTIRALCGTRDSNWFVTGGTDRIIRCWEGDQPTKSQAISYPERRSFRYSVSAEKDVSVTTEECINRTSQSHRNFLTVPKQHKDCVTALALLRPMPGFCNIPLLVSASRDGCVKLWQSSSMKPPDRVQH
eukprot:TRINITY_DN27237_c0_g1_i1.p1 TRINITY_DN27237_c0_g1~~TRINITY_DN27237_c0_g1_i1.p1  ORF type:complete len:1311 (+),score=487.29 TRINITY_DN27237_c0_g1_i1:184-4116(+)